MDQIDREPTYLQKLEDTARRKSIERFSIESMKFFKKRMLMIFKGSARRRIINERPTENRLFTGAMYTFRYEEKFKNELSYWDAFPLIIMIGPVDKLSGPAFSGLNLHYLRPERRSKLMNALQATVSDKRYTDSARMCINYEMLEESSLYRAYKPCYTNYLMSFVRSKLVRIDPDEWDAALYLPLEQWQKAGKRAVWADSEKMIRGE